MEEMKLIAIRSFLEKEKLYKSHKSVQSFKAEVECKDFFIKDVTTVKIYTKDKYGSILIDETAIINQSTFYISFDPNWQNYEFDEKNNVLIINGIAKNKGGRHYTVTIRPIK